jgi:ribosomal protein L3 glutamine methyltransferase
MPTPDETSALTTVRDLVRWGASRFAHAGLAYGHGTDNALDEAFHLVLHALRLPADLPAVYLEAHVTASEREAVLDLLMARVETRLPAAYLIGEIQFCGLSFTVDERVLVPRSPFAELIAQRFEPWLPAEPARILDLCTGSGCIAIAMAHYNPDWQVDAVDVSPEALSLARENVERLHATNVRLVESDLFHNLDGEAYDLIVTNPPYVNAPSMAELPEEYRREPELALASGKDGLEHIRRILADAPGHLNPGGLLIAEIGHNRDALEAAFPQLPFVWLDTSGGDEYVFLLRHEDIKPGRL